MGIIHDESVVDARFGTGSNKMVDRKGRGPGDRTLLASWAILLRGLRHVLPLDGGKRIVQIVA